MVIDGRAWCVNTNTGTWYGGFFPHQPFHSSSRHGPRIGPNMIHAPTLANPRTAKSSLMPVAPFSEPYIFWKVRVDRIQSIIARPPTPSGCRSSSRRGDERARSKSTREPILFVRTRKGSYFVGLRMRAVGARSGQRGRTTSCRRTIRGKPPIPRIQGDAAETGGARDGIEARRALAYAS